MTVVYLETSAVLGRLFGESSAETVIDRMNKADVLPTSELTRIETIRSVRRAAREGLITQSERHAVRELFGEHLSGWFRMSMDESVIDRATQDFPREPVGISGSAQQKRSYGSTATAKRHPCGAPLFFAVAFHHARQAVIQCGRVRFSWLYAIISSFAPGLVVGPVLMGRSGAASGIDAGFGVAALYRRAYNKAYRRVGESFRKLLTSVRMQLG